MPHSERRQSVLEMDAEAPVPAQDNDVAGVPVASRYDKPAVARTLYISYDGILEPLGESQVVAYVERLARHGPMTLISFEKRRDSDDQRRMHAMRMRLAQQGIGWAPRRYHKRPSVLSTAYDVLAGVLTGVRLARANRCNIVHARGYVPSLIALAVKRATGARFLFDMRGFWADEKVDAGHWSEGSLLYRMTKAWERRFFESADGIVSLTEAGVAAFAGLKYRIRPGIPIMVIPTCTDLERFSPGSKDHGLASSLGLAGHVVVGCTGTMSNWYLRDAMLAGLAHIARRLDRVKILMVTREDHERLRADAHRAGVRPHQLVLMEAPFQAMPTYMRLMDVGLFFIKSSFSKKGSSATKLGEFLASGVPVIINDGVGDSGWIVRQHRVGVVLDGVAPSDFNAAAEEVRRLLADPLVASRCRQTAERYFDLGEGVAKYRDLYDGLVVGAAMSLRAG